MGIGIALGAVALIAAVIVIGKVSQATSGIATLLAAIRHTDFTELEAEYETTPKSVSGMTSLCIPRITADFPEFNWYEFKQKAENMLLSAFRAISEEDASLVQNASHDLRTQIALLISANRDAHVHEIYRDVQIHQTEIRDYRRQGGTCIITLQSAVGFLHALTRDGSAVDGNDVRKCQKRYDIELLYVQDVSRVSDGQKTLGSTCPNCGAPSRDLGSKVCAYCGCQLTEINVRVWSINRYTEV